MPTEATFMVKAGGRDSHRRPSRPVHHSRDPCGRRRDHWKVDYVDRMRPWRAIVGEIEGVNTSDYQTYEWSQAGIDGTPVGTLG